MTPTPIDDSQRVVPVGMIIRWSAALDDALKSIGYWGESVSATEMAAMIAAAPAASPPVAPEDRRDGERYRWLRSQPNDTSVPRIDVVHWVEDDESANAGTGLRMEALDAAIDAAREG